VSGLIFDVLIFQTFYYEFVLFIAGRMITQALKAMQRGGNVFLYVKRFTMPLKLFI
jgi:hypothetical protein